MISPVNDAPIGINDTYTVDEDNALTGDVISGNDVDADNDPLNATLVNGPANAEEFTLNPDGSFTYVPVSNFNGNDSFEYQVSDGHGGFDTASVEITVVPVNDLPMVQSDTVEFVFGQDQSSSASVLLNDVDIDGDALIAVLADPPSNGTLTLRTDGNFVYTPNPGFFGFDTFTYVASDGIGNTATTVEIEVLGVAVVNNGPSAEANLPTPPIESAPESTINNEDLFEEASEETDEEEAQPISALLVGSINEVPVLNLTKQLEFQIEEENAEAIDLITSKTYAESVLRAILVGSTNFEVDVETQATELDKFNARHSTAAAVFDANFLFEQIESHAEAIDEFKEFKVAVGALTSVGSIGYILWTLRGGALMAVALAQIPSWQMIDPLPVLDSYSSNQTPEDDELGGFF